MVNEKMLSQKQNDNQFYFIALFFKNMNSIECNYKIYNKKLLTVTRCFEQ